MMMGARALPELSKTTPRLLRQCSLPGDDNPAVGGGTGCYRYNLFEGVEEVLAVLDLGKRG